VSAIHLARVAANYGLELAGVWQPVRLLADDVERLQAWQAKGMAGDMAYMQRPGELLGEPQQLLPSVRSVVSFAAYYDRGASPLEVPSGYGRVARYAWGRDYHRVLSKALASLVQEVTGSVSGPLESRVFTDAVPLLERAAARVGGAGFIGKNTLLIQPRGRGSFFFLAEILWNAEVTEVPSTDSNQSSCGSCMRCLSACPTGAFPTPFTLDARRCISYLTIEKRGLLTLQERSWLGSWVFGCDICQEVCPFNHQALDSVRPPDLAEFSPSHGAGPILKLEEILQLRTDEKFILRFQGTALMRAKRAGLLRNAAVVAANTAAVSLVPELRKSATEDISDIVRAHSLWALGKLGSADGTKLDQEMRRVIERALQDPSEIVRAEAARFLGEGTPG
jgi:epoxyqueuosine reductase